MLLFPAKLKPSTVLAYARMLGPYTSAPPRHVSPDMDTVDRGDPVSIPGALLPYPTEEVMRRGRLGFDEVGAIGETTEMTGGGSPCTPAHFLHHRRLTPALLCSAGHPWPNYV